MNYEAEAVMLHRKIDHLIHEVQTKSVARRQEEDLFILSSTNEDCVRRLFAHESPSPDRVRKLLQEHGEEDLVEEECLHQCKAFVKSKCNLFTETGTNLDNASVLLTTYIFGNTGKASHASGVNELPVGTVSLCNELHEFYFLLDAVARLHWLTSTDFLGHKLSFSTGKDKCLIEKEEELSAYEAHLNETMFDSESQIFEMTSRLQSLQHKLNSLKTESEIGVGKKNAKLVMHKSHDDDNAVAATKNALETLQAATENLLRRTQETVSIKSSLREKLNEVTTQTIACKQAVNSFTQSTEILLKAVDDLQAKYAFLSGELDAKERYRLQQRQLLIEKEASYEELKLKMSRLTDTDNAKAAHVNNAAIEHWVACLRIDSAKQNAIALKTTNAALNELLSAAHLEKERLADELQYLASLITDKAVVERIMSRHAKNLECPNTLQITQNYLDFIQKARESQRTRLNAP